jgi:CDP-glycerol glycerophosphotransferase (TagB/SpsB family)
MNNVLKQIKYWSQIFLLPIYLVTFLFPRSKKIWVLGSTFGKRFADNPKYFYLYLNQYQSDNIRAIWISKNKEIIKLLNSNSLEGFYLYSVKGIWYSLRAKIYLYDNYSKDICFTLSGGAIKINMWHGIPLKKIQKDNKFDFVRNPRNKCEQYKWLLRRISDEKPKDYILATSKFFKPIFGSAFRTKNVLVGGYPRNDYLVFDSIKNILPESEINTLKQMEYNSQNYKIAMYMPTFRNSESNFFDIISIKDFKMFLEKEKIIFYIKVHPKSPFKEKYNNIIDTNIKVIDSDADPYAYLKKSDILITDYSSIYFDFLLTKKPIIFFPYDYKEYLNSTRELYFDYMDFTPNIKVYTQSELENALINCFYDAQKALKVVNKAFDTVDKFASEHLYNEINDILLKR